MRDQKCMRGDSQAATKPPLLMNNKQQILGRGYTHQSKVPSRSVREELGKQTTLALVSVKCFEVTEESMTGLTAACRETVR